MTNCCIQFGAASSKKPKQCLDLCDGSTPIKYDAKYTLCEPVQGAIMSCGIESYDDQLKHKIILKSGNEALSPTSSPEYTYYPSDYNYLIYGHVSCEDGQPVGEDAQVILMENDPVSPNDEVARVDIIGNEFTIPAPIDRENDFPTSEFELYLVFEKACNYWRSRASGVVLSEVNVSYVLLDQWFERYAYVPV
uniref:Uncharacterized protein n=1 Tax=Panagrolaimus davidi TaxID=227884 RepID=A0A914P6M0_9BILA